MSWLGIGLEEDEDSPLERESDVARCSVYRCGVSEERVWCASGIVIWRIWRRLRLGKMWWSLLGVVKDRSECAMLRCWIADICLPVFIALGRINGSGDDDAGDGYADRGCTAGKRLGLADINLVGSTRLRS